VSRHWTDEEEDTLRKIYAEAGWDKLLSEFPSRKKRGIVNKAHRLGLKRNRCKTYCDECGARLVQGQQGLECPNPDCEISYYQFSRGGHKLIRVVRAVVIQ